MKSALFFSLSQGQQPAKSSKLGTAIWCCLLGFLALAVGSGHAQSEDSGELKKGTLYGPSSGNSCEGFELENSRYCSLYSNDYLGPPDYIPGIKGLLMIKDSDTNSVTQLVSLGYKRVVKVSDFDKMFETLIIPNLPRVSSTLFGCPFTETGLKGLVTFACNALLNTRNDSTSDQAQKTCLRTSSNGERKTPPGMCLETTKAIVDSAQTNLEKDSTCKDTTKDSLKNGSDLLMRYARSQSAYNDTSSNCLSYLTNESKIGFCNLQTDGQACKEGCQSDKLSCSGAQKILGLSTIVFVLLVALAAIVSVGLTVAALIYYKKMKQASLDSSSANGRTSFDSENGHGREDIKYGMPTANAGRGDSAAGMPDVLTTASVANKYNSRYSSRVSMANSDNEVLGVIGAAASASRSANPPRVQSMAIDEMSGARLEKGPMTPEVVRFDFEPARDDEMGLREGDLILVEEEFEDGWGFGRKVNRAGKELESGAFPLNCIFLD